MSHRDVMLSLVREHGWKRGAELGVASGQLFGLLLRECPDLFLIGVDRMAVPDRAEKVRALARKYEGRCILHACLTAEAASLVIDGSLDFVFIDADHRYSAVREDIERWRPKVRAGGWLTGHDYNRGAYPGVIKAVDQAFGDAVRIHDWNVWSVAL